MNFRIRCNILILLSCLLLGIAAPVHAQSEIERLGEKVGNPIDDIKDPGRAFRRHLSTAVENATRPFKWTAGLVSKPFQKWIEQLAKQFEDVARKSMWWGAVILTALGFLLALPSLLCIAILIVVLRRTRALDRAA